MEAPEIKLRQEILKLKRDKRKLVKVMIELMEKIVKLEKGVNNELPKM